MSFSKWQGVTEFEIAAFLPLHYIWLSANCYPLEPPIGCFGWFSPQYFLMYKKLTTLQRYSDTLQGTVLTTFTKFIIG